VVPGPNEDDPLDGDHCVVMTTVGSEDAARQLCRPLVEGGLVACAQLVPIGSIYRWQGEMVEDRETLVLCKTSRSRSPEVVEALQADHPYDLPEIIELPVTGGSPAYLRWIDDQTRSEA
jgi:periplasmic divalent cation tolerance protein